MSKKIILSIPKPCHENWNNMTPVEQGRFCGSCQKDVIDFSRMSNSEVASFFKKPQDSICGRFRQEQLGQAIDLPRKRIPWIRYFFQIALPAFLFSAKVSAQGKVRLTGDTIATPVKEPVRMMLGRPVALNERQISGKLIDENGGPVSLAKVQVAGNDKREVLTDENGRFSFTIVQKGDVILNLSAQDFSDRQVKGGVDQVIMMQVKKPVLIRGLIRVEDLKKQGSTKTVDTAITEKSFNVTITGTQVDSVAAISGEESATLKEKIQKEQPLSVQNTAPTQFSVYPNPAPYGKKVYAYISDAEGADHIMIVEDVNGNRIRSKTVRNDLKTQLVEIDLVSKLPGIYFVRLQNRRTGKIAGVQLIIQ